MMIGSQQPAHDRDFQSPTLDSRCSSAKRRLGARGRTARSDPPDSKADRWASHPVMASGRVREPTSLILNDRQSPEQAVTHRDRVPELRMRCTPQERCEQRQSVWPAIDMRCRATQNGTVPLRRRERTSNQAPSRDSVIETSRARGRKASSRRALASIRDLKISTRRLTATSPWGMYSGRVYEERRRRVTRTAQTEVQIEVQLPVPGCRVSDGGMTRVVPTVQHGMNGQAREQARCYLRCE